MKFLKVIILFFIIATAFAFVLTKFAEFDLNSAIFISVGTVVLSFLIPEIKKAYIKRQAS